MRLGLPFGLAAAAVLAGLGCASARTRRPAGEVSPAFLRAAVVHTAAELVGTRRSDLGGKRYASDCAGFVRMVFDAHGIDLYATGRDLPAGGVGAILRYVRERGEVHRGPVQPGDLVFFRDTYDRNRDGLENDGLTHVGIVESVEGDGTVTVIHRVERGVVRYRMNAAHPLTRAVGGRIVNDWLRKGKGGRPKLAGELFASYGSVVRSAQTSTMASGTAQRR